MSRDLMNRLQELLWLIFFVALLVTVASILETALYVGHIRLRDYHLFLPCGCGMAIGVLFFDLIHRDEGMDNEPA